MTRFRVRDIALVVVAMLLAAACGAAPTSTPTPTPTPPPPPPPAGPVTVDLAPYKTGEWGYVCYIDTDEESPPPEAKVFKGATVPVLVGDEEGQYSGPAPLDITANTYCGVGFGADTVSEESGPDDWRIRGFFAYALRGPGITPSVPATATILDAQLFLDQTIIEEEYGMFDVSEYGGPVYVLLVNYLENGLLGGGDWLQTPHAGPLPVSFDPLPGGRQVTVTGFVQTAHSQAAFNDPTTGVQYVGLRLDWAAFYDVPNTNDSDTDEVARYTPTLLRVRYLP